MSDSPTAVDDSSALKPVGTSIRDRGRFVSRFLSNPGTVGAILPSSRFLADAMVLDLGLTAGDLVVEYGPGTGPMTQALHQLDLAGRGIRYLGIELDDTFHRALTMRFPTLDFHVGSVEDIETILTDRGLGRARVIISGLPFALLDTEVQRSVVAGSYAVLGDGGEFRTFLYVHAYRLKAAKRFREMMAEKFGRFVRSTPLYRNVPPAYVLTYRKPGRRNGNGH